MGHSGTLSKHPEEALAGRGESVRQLRFIKSKLRAELQPQGVLADILFDRAWSCYLRCKLIALAEGSLLAPKNNPANSANSIPTLREDDLPTLVFEQSDLTGNLSAELLRHLVIVQRYDSHFSREFYRAIGMLLELRNNGKSGLTLRMRKTFGHEVLEDEDG
jgi:hypothetical protein